LADHPRERRTHFLLNVARAHDQEGEATALVRTLLQAEALAPEEVACAPVARDLVLGVVRRRGPLPVGARELAGRLGVAA